MLNAAVARRRRRARARAAPRRSRARPRRLAVVLLCGAATALAGPIVFVGLVVPARGPPHHRPRLPLDPAPTAALLGAILLVAADVVGRFVARPGEIEAGIVLAFVGAPVMIALVRGSRLLEPVSPAAATAPAASRGIAVVRGVRERRRRRERRRDRPCLAALILVVAGPQPVRGRVRDPHRATCCARCVGQGQGLDEVIVMRIRLPRLVLGVLVGVAFALSGALFQSLLRQPAREPRHHGDLRGRLGGRGRTRSSSWARAARWSRWPRSWAALGSPRWRSTCWRGATA